MNENWYRQLAQERHRELLKEANDARLLREAGVKDAVPGAVKLVGLVLLGLPFVVMLVRAVAKV
jgi:hypothetical protein